MRVTGMTWMRTPLFVWSMFIYSALLLLIVPVFAATLTMLLLDREDGTHFFTHGGGAALFVHAFWFLGRPEVYILLLPAIGIVSEVLPVFSGRPIYRFTWAAYSLVALGCVFLLVWAHRTFVVGIHGYVHVVLIIAAVVIAAVVALLFADWLATICHHGLRFDSPLLFALGFVFLLAVGGLSRLAVAIFGQHGSAEVTAHLHYTVFGSALFAILAGLHYWWPKVYGRLLDERLAKASFWLLFAGFNIAFLFEFLLGRLGLGSGVATYSGGGHLESYNVVSTAGSGVMAVGILVLLVNVFRTQRSGRRAGNDPWRATRSSGTRPHRRPSTTSTRCLPSAAPVHWPISAIASRSTMRAEPAPGPWLRLTALGASAAVLVAVVSGASGLGMAHRVLAALALPPLIAVAVAAVLEYRRLIVPAFLSLALFGLAALVTAPGLHLAAAAAALASTVVTAALTFRGEPMPNGPWRDYVTLTKPRIMTLLLLTGACGMFVGAEGWPPLGLFVATMAGLALACGGASALNHMLDRDIDVLMGKRTDKRPVAAGRVSAPHALEFGLALMALSFVLLAGTVNVLTATLALVGGLFYVIVYTRLLKRNTAQNIVIGGAAGAVPPLVGYAAATGDLTLTAIWLFLIVFFWTPPHFWALALLLKDEYAAAKVPMLPVVRGERATVRQILVYSYVLIAITLVPYLMGWMGLAYLVAAIGLGGGFVALAWHLARRVTPKRASLLFHYSLLYLALLFVAMAVDAVIA